MKQPKKLTKHIKIQVANQNLNPLDWLLISESKSDYAIINKTSGEVCIHLKSNTNAKHRQKAV